MGLATIDPHSHKMQTKFYKIPTFGVNRLNSKQDLQPDAVRTASRNFPGEIKVSYSNKIFHAGPQKRGFSGMSEVERSLSRI